MNSAVRGVRGAAQVRPEFRLEPTLRILASPDISASGAKRIFGRPYV
jgi:hypothetical protein